MKSGYLFWGLIVLLSSFALADTLDCWFDPVYQEPSPTGSNLRDVWCNFTNSSGGPVLGANITDTTFDVNDWWLNGIMSDKGWIVGYQSINNLTGTNYSVYGTQTIDSSKVAQIRYGPFTFPFDHLNQSFNVLVKAGTTASELSLYVCNNSLSDLVFGNTPVYASLNNYCVYGDTVNVSSTGANYDNWTWVSFDVVNAYNSITENMSGAQYYSVVLSSQDNFSINPLGWSLSSVWVPPIFNATIEGYNMTVSSLKNISDTGLPDGHSESGGFNMSGCVGHWHFDELSGNAVDVSGFGNNGYLYGNITQGVAGRMNKSYDFLDRSSRVVVSNSSSLFFNQTFSWELWMKPETIYSYMGLLLSGGAVDWSDESISLQFWTGGKIRFNILNPAGGAYSYVESNTIFSANNWYYVAATFDGSVMRLYVNGVEDNFRASTRLPALTNAKLIIGAQVNGTNTWNPSYGAFGFDGLLDEVAVYNRTLGSNEVWWRYLNGKKLLKPDSRIYNVSDYNVLYTQRENILLSDNLSFDASSDYLDFDENDDVGTFENISSFVNVDNNSFTSCFFFKRTRWGVFYEKPWTCDLSMEILFFNSTLRFALQREASSSWYLVESAVLPEDTVWHHVCGARNTNQSRLELFFDGELVTTRSFSNSYLIKNPSECVVGRDTASGGSDEHFRGQMGQFYFFNTSLSSSQIKEQINTAFWELGLGFNSVSDVYAQGSNYNSTHILWSNEPERTPLAYVKILNVNNMTYNSSNGLYFFQYYTNKAEFAASQGSAGVNFTSFWSVNNGTDDLNDTAHWYVRGASNSSCTINNYNWSDLSRTGQYQNWFINWSVNSTIPVNKQGLVVCNPKGECNTYDDEGVINVEENVEYGNASFYCYSQNDFDSEQRNSSVYNFSIGCWNPYNDYDGTKNTLEMESDVYLCSGNHTVIAKSGGDYPVLRNDGSYKLYLTGETLIDGGNVYYEGVDGAWNTVYWAYNLKNRVFDARGLLTIQNSEIGFFTDTYVSNFTIANVKFINVSIPLDLEHSVASNFTITNNTFTGCGINGQDSVYVTGPNVNIVHNYFNALNPAGDKHIYCSGCSNVTLEQNYYSDIDGLNIFTNGSNRTVSTYIGDFNCVIGVYGSQYPYANYSTPDEIFLNGALLSGEIKDLYPCTDKELNSTPVINLISPSDGHSQYDSSALLWFNLSDEASGVFNDTNCTLVFDGAVNDTLFNLTENSDYNFSVSGLSLGAHYWNVSCVNRLNNSNISSTWSFVRSAVPSGGGGGGGGSSSSVSLQSQTTTMTQAVQSVALRTGDSVSFSVQNQQHSLTVNSISTAVAVTVASEPKQYVLQKGQTLDLDLTGDNQTDFIVTLDSIEYNVARFTLQVVDFANSALYDKLPEMKEKSQESRGVDKVDDSLVPVQDSVLNKVFFAQSKDGEGVVVRAYVPVLGIVLILLLFVCVVFFAVHKRRKRHL